VTDLNGLDFQLSQEIDVIDRKIVKRKRKISSNKVLDENYYPYLPAVAPVKVTTKKKAAQSLIKNALLDSTKRPGPSGTRKAVGKARSQAIVSVVPQVER